QQAVHQWRIFRLSKIHKPQVGIASRQRFLVEARRVAVEHHLITATGQCLLQHMTLQRGIGDHCNTRSEEHTSELQSRENLVCRLLLEKKNTISLYQLYKTEPAS